MAAAHARRRLGVRRVLIVDWDAHHGNGTQRIFQSDASVLFVSIHRHDRGAFFPSSPYGSHWSVGIDEGRGYWAPRPHLHQDRGLPPLDLLHRDWGKPSPHLHRDWG